MAEKRARPVEHKRNATVDKNGRAVSGSLVNKGVEQTRRLMSQRERELYAIQSEALKDLSTDEVEETDGRLMPHRDRSIVGPPKSITETIQDRPVPVTLDDLITLEDLGELEGFQDSNAIWSNGDSDTPIRVTRILDERGPNGEQYARVAGSNTAIPLDQIVFVDDSFDLGQDRHDATDTIPVLTEDDIIRMSDPSPSPDDFSHLPPPPNQFSHLPPPPNPSATMPGPLASFLGSSQVQSLAKEYPILKYVPRIAVSFGAAVVAFNAAALILPAAVLGSAVTMMAISGGALAPEIYRMRKVKLSPEWGRFQTVSKWDKRQCSRWEKAGFSPAEAMAWDQVFAARPNLRPTQHRPGGSSAEARIAEDFKNVFEISGSEGVGRAAPYIKAWMTPQDVLTWQQYGVTSDEEMRAVVALHAAASAEKGGGRVPAFNLAQDYFSSRGLPTPVPSNDNILYTKDMAPPRAEKASSDAENGSTTSPQ